MVIKVEAVGSGEDNNKDDTSTRRSERQLLLSRLIGVGCRTKGYTREERREWGCSCLALDEARCRGIYMQTETIQDEVCYAQR